MSLWYGEFLSNSLLILADETDSQSWRSPLKAISEFFKGDPKGDFMETGLHFPVGCCSNLCNRNASCWPYPRNCLVRASSASLNVHAMLWLTYPAVDPSLRLVFRMGI